MPSHLVRLAALTLAYTATGLMAIQLAAPPGYAAPVFPAAGIALSALLIFGNRMWPAVFLGSFLVQIGALLQTSGNAGAWWGAALAAAAVALQAVIGAGLARYIVGFPNALDTPRPILRFLGIVAPLSSIVAPTIAVPVLLVSGTIPASEVTFSWWNWWVGDTLGIVIAAPLMFVLFGQPAEDWRSRRLGVIVPLGLAIVLIAFAFHQVRSWEALRTQTQFNRDVEHIASLVRKRLEVQIDMMLAIERLMAVSEHVTRSDFRNFVVPWLQRNPGSQNFGWSPHVLDASRSAFEQSVAAEGFPGFSILARDPAGRTFVAPPTAEYLPLTYVEPFQSNTGAFGLDPLSLETTARAITETRRTGLPASSPAIRLVQEMNAQRGVVVYLAVRQHQLNVHEFRGVISGAFRMDDSIAAAAELARQTGVELCLVDRDGAADNRRLSGSPQCETDDWLDTAVSKAVPISFGGRAWELRLRADRNYVGGMRSWAAWSTVAVGLVAVGLLGAFLLITSGTSRRVAALVDRRTAELAAATARVREQQDAIAEAQRLARMGSWEVRAGSDLVDGSHALFDILGRAPQALRTLDDLVASVAPADRGKLRQALDERRASPGHSVLDGAPDCAPDRVVQLQIESQWRDGSLHRVRGTVQDVSAEREAEAHIQYLAHVDHLTGLPNRNAWLSQAQTAIASAQRRGEPLGVLFLDLDHFKTVNDSLGHPVGDRLLATVARRLSACLREEDVLARLGGDEFVAMLPHLPRPDDAAQVARKLLDIIADPIHIEGHDLAPSVSIGIAIFPDDGTDVDTLLKHADTAMYGAKAAGRNNFQFFVQEMNIRAFERLTLENALRRAIERNQLTLHYQPQVEAASGRLYGCEALVRWQHPDLGLVPPMQFIPVAEDSGLIVPLGEWVLREACRQQVLWRDGPLGALHIAVNISALQFLRTDFLATVLRVLADTGADPAQLEFEITETALMQPTDELTERLLQLQRLGLTLALDDFGTGYSSLAYLRRMPIGRLKIDRSFVKDLPGDPEDAAVASATLSLARDLGLEVIAEGVETAEQRDYLAARGCHALQGFLFARPLTAAAFETWAEEHRGDA